MRPISRRAAGAIAVGLSAVALRHAPLLGDEAEPKWTALFNGKDLEGWKPLTYGGPGEVEVVEKSLHIGAGEPMTAVVWKGEKPPKEDFEIVCKAQRIEGVDFFAALTFPIGDGFGTFVPAGWSGGVTGLSSINNFDASENETTTYHKFENKVVYTFRIQVTKKTVQAFVDKDRVLRVTREGKKFNTRLEVDDCKPLGLSTYRTHGVIEELKHRALSPDEIAAIDKPVE